MNVLFVLAQNGFRDEEYLIPRQAIEGAGNTVLIASETRGECVGALGAKVHSEYSLDEVEPSRFDAVVVVGGSGSPKYLWNNKRLYEILQKIYGAGGVVAAICLSGAVLANAGLLKGKKATVFETTDSLAALKEGGAIHLREANVVDGRIVTANGPSAAQIFGENIASLLT